MKKVKLYIILSLLLAGLVLVRAFQNTLFYDPLIDYFKWNYLNSALPEIEKVRYLLNLLFRYVLNTTLSLGIIYFLFRDSKILIFSIKFYFLLFVILVTCLVPLLEVSEYKMLLFYVRRFLIQPLFLFVLIPAFYYQKLKRSGQL